MMNEKGGQDVTGDGAPDASSPPDHTQEQSAPAGKPDEMAAANASTQPSDSAPTTEQPGGTDGTVALPVSNIDATGKIGKYPLIRRLGSGNMGEVWLGHHPDLDLPVAVKILPAHLTQNREAYTARFVREARAAARINHSNVVRVYDAGMEGNLPYMVMEYVDGGDLDDRLERAGGKLSVPEAVAVVRCVAEALAAATKVSIVHRDIKPSNVMLDSDGTPKLADLGLAKQLDADDSGLTGTGIALGTPNYIPPEQVIGKQSPDVRADIYSLGVVFYQLVTGRLPYQGGSSFEVMRQHLDTPMPPAKEVEPELPDALCNVIERMTAKDPADRYQTPQALIEDLDAMAAVVVGDGATHVGGGRQAWWWAVAAGVLLLAAILVGRSLRSEDEGLPPPGGSAEVRPPENGDLGPPEQGRGLDDPRTTVQEPGVRHPPPLAETPGAGDMQRPGARLQGRLQRAMTHGAEPPPAEIVTELYREVTPAFKDKSLLVVGLPSIPIAPWLGARVLPMHPGRWTMLSRLAPSDPQEYPALLCIADTRYIGTTLTRNDNIDAIRRYLEAGGLFVVYPGRSLCLLYDGSTYVGLKTNRYLGVPLADSVLETRRVPANGEWRIAEELPGDWSTTVAAGSSSYGWYPAAPPETDDKYTAYVSLVDADGKWLGDAMALVEYTASAPRGGRVLYVWAGLAEALGTNEFHPAFFRLLAQYTRERSESPTP